MLVDSCQSLVVSLQQRKYNILAMPQKNQKVVVIVGPTATSKSDLAVWLAKKIDGEIVSADSRQVYRGLDIGTGKITKKEMRGVPHYLLDVADPREQFSADDFVHLGRETLRYIVRKGKIPIIVGGTGFYIDALLGKISLPRVAPNAQLRKKLQKLPAEKLFVMLKNLDPKRAKTIDKNNPVRLIRAIEIARALGKVPKQRNTMIYHSLLIGFTLPESELKSRIHKRLLMRMKQGMTAEAKRLRKNGLSFRRMRELGLEYRHLADYLQGKCTKEDMLATLERSIWQYAKRQKTWFRKDKAIKWFSPMEKKSIEREVKKFSSGR